jgi:cytochrome c peroxidase
VIIILGFTPIKTSVFTRPKDFPDPIYNFSANPLSDDKIELGRALFYDPLLSKDNQISCASCHSPYNAFAHTDHDLSHGIDDEIGNRNAPALFNLAWQQSFMWDGAINHLDMQALAPISHPKEMGESIENVVHKLNGEPLYSTLFNKAYGDSIATGEKVLKSLAQFQLSLVSSNAKYDKVKSKSEAFTEQELKGYNLFLKNCNSCHAEPLFSNYAFKSNGLPIDTTLNDYGKWTITKNSNDSLLFKVPSLRNLSYTYPYMHDGRFTSLYNVINHYTNIQPDSSLVSTELNKTISFTNNNKTDLIAFLLTLNDKEFVFDKQNKYPTYLFNN